MRIWVLAFLLAGCASADVEPTHENALTDGEPDEEPERVEGVDNGPPIHQIAFLSEPMNTEPSRTPFVISAPENVTSVTFVARFEVDYDDILLQFEGIDCVGRSSTHYVAAYAELRGTCNDVKIGDHDAAFVVHGPHAGFTLTLEGTAS